MLWSKRLSLRIEAGALAVLAGVALAGQARATSICGSIRMELSTDVETIGSTRETRAYQQAISRQQREIATVQRDLVGSAAHPAASSCLAARMPKPVTC